MEPQQQQQTIHPESRPEPIASVEEVAQPLDTFGKIVFLVIVIEIALMIGLNLYENSRLTTISDDLSSKQQQLASTDFAQLNTQVTDVLSGQQKLQQVLASKLNWASFYTALNAITPKDTRLTSMSIGSGGSFKASGETTSLTSLANALAAWQSGTVTVATPFSSVALNSEGYTTDTSPRRVSFSISGQVNLSKLGGL